MSLLLVSADEKIPMCGRSSSWVPDSSLSIRGQEGRNTSTCIHEWTQTTDLAATFSLLDSPSQKIISISFRLDTNNDEGSKYHACFALSRDSIYAASSSRKVTPLLRFRFNIVLCLIRVKAKECSVLAPLLWGKQSF
jgi:hypothetical protein